MAIYMTWEWEADGLAGAQVQDIEDAVSALTSSVRRAACRYGTQEQTENMVSCVAPVQRAMRTDGVAALNQGRNWSTNCGGLYVALSPRPRSLDA